MLAFVTNPGSDSVSIFDTATNTVVKKVSVGVDSTVGAAITPDGKIAYVSDRGARNVGVIDIATGVLVSTIEIGKNDPFLVPNANPIAITPDGKHAYVTDANGSVLVIYTATNKVVASVKVGDTPAGVAITPDGRLQLLNLCGQHL
jgi:YVTN family beta-propeller protein